MPTISFVVVLPTLPVMPTTLSDRAGCAAIHRERLQRGERVADDVLRDLGRAPVRATRAPVAPRLRGVGDEVVTIGVLAGQGDEEIAPAGLAGIDDGVAKAHWPDGWRLHEVRPQRHREFVRSDHARCLSCLRLPAIHTMSCQRASGARDVLRAGRAIRGYRFLSGGTPR